VACSSPELMDASSEQPMLAFSGAAVEIDIEIVWLDGPPAGIWLPETAPMIVIVPESVSVPEGSAAVRERMLPPDGAKVPVRLAARERLTPPVEAATPSTIVRPSCVRADVVLVNAYSITPSTDVVKVESPFFSTELKLL